MRTRMLGLAAALIGGLGVTTAAQAGPFGRGYDDGFDGPRREGPPIERVADGCGPGWHSNPWGRCRPNRWGGGGYGPPRGAYGPPPVRGGYERDWDRPRPRYYGGY